MADVIRFDNGLKEYSLNDAVTVCFNPTDIKFIERVFDVFDEMDKKQEAYKAEIDKVDDRKVFDLANRYDAEIREMINGIFGQDVCTPLFGGMSVNTLADGLPLWANLFFAIVDTFDGAFVEQKKRTNPRIKKYTEKYSKKR